MDGISHGGDGLNFLRQDTAPPTFRGVALTEIKIEIARAAAAAADEVLLEREAAAWSVYEDVDANRAWLVGVAEENDAPDLGWNELAAALAEAGVGALGAPTRRSLADEDWKNSYKRHFHAWKFGRLNWVPVWERETFVLPAGEAVLWLDPGMAFGTGNHETTRLVVERLVTLSDPNRTSARVIDAGCGSGILALSAALLGYRRVAAFDLDPLSIDVSRENAALNGLEDRVEFFVGDLTSGLAGREAEIVLANIQADVLMKFSRELLGAVAADGVLVLSGILARELAQVKETFAAQVPRWAVDARVLGEWSDLTLTRRA